MHAIQWTRWVFIENFISFLSYNRHGGKLPEKIHGIDKRRFVERSRHGVYISSKNRGEILVKGWEEQKKKKKHTASVWVCVRVAA